MANRYAGDLLILSLAATLVYFALSISADTTDINVARLCNLIMGVVPIIALLVFRHRYRKSLLNSRLNATELQNKGMWFVAITYLLSVPVYFCSGNFGCAIAVVLTNAAITMVSFTFIVMLISLPSR